mmetsp:Transcript_52283/g.131274  ORF Transcript_52283/g.131274 Transcript_52283/m.131274 type:complete len:356 (+) Transcript_52283:38-1105(+)
MSGLAKPQLLGDCFETPDAVDDTVVAFTGPSKELAQEAEDIDASSINVGKASKQFAGRSLSTKNADFSENVARAHERRRNNIETPSDKLERLTKEVSDLREALKQAAPTTPSPTEMLSHLDQLSQDLFSVALSASSSVGSTTASRTESSDKPATPSNTAQASIKASALEKRIAALEAIVGAPEAGSGADFAVGSGGLAKHLARMELRLASLDPARLDGVRQRLKELVDEFKKMKQLQAAAAATSGVGVDNTADLLNPATCAKVDKVYQWTTKMEGQLHALPAVLDRMQTLQQLHVEAATFAEAVRLLKDQQDSIAASLANDRELLQKLEGTFSQNLKTLQGNMEAIERRIEGLKK